MVICFPDVAACLLVTRYPSIKNRVNNCPGEDGAAQLSTSSVRNDTQLEEASKQRKSQCISVNGFLPSLVTSLISFVSTRTRTGPSAPDNNEDPGDLNTKHLQLFGIRDSEMPLAVEV